MHALYLCWLKNTISTRDRHRCTVQTWIQTSTDLGLWICNIPCDREEKIKGYEYKVDPIQGLLDMEKFT